MNKVFVTAIIPKAGIDIFKKNKVQVVQHDSYLPISKSELIRKAKDCDAILSLLINKIDSSIINNLPKLKIISNYAVGYNNIDFLYASKKNIWVTNTPDILTNATADLTLGLLIACARKFREADIFTRKGKFKSWQSDLMLGKELHGKNLGIIGTGRIGKAVATRAAGFGLKIFYNNLERDLPLEMELKAKYLSLDGLLRICDFISIHTPLTPKTYHLIDKKKFALMKQDAVLINTSRGEVIDERALVQALKSKKLFSAGLDVYEFEPKITKELQQFENIILLPHIGSATEEARNKMAEIAAQNIVNVLKGKKPLTPVMNL
ncbi:MAG: D-glycerate dehydrogenase [Bacteroidetes bacterium]|nr:D-glycerate dehydrogenase [Bacteroidota bacterium]MBU2585388.1 D-glycerate dehydrogenase [Bacteroidota bacterium]